MRSFILTITPLAIALGLVGLATAAFGAQDQPFTVNGVTAVCTGVGSAKDNPEWSSYPVKIVLANTAGEDLAAAHFTVASSGRTVLETDCDAPWLLLKGPAGQYSASATVGGQQAKSASFTMSGSGPQKELTLMFQRRQASAQ